jgi:hypothetical protein
MTKLARDEESAQTCLIKLAQSRRIIQDLEINSVILSNAKTAIAPKDVI